MHKQASQQADIEAHRTQGVFRLQSRTQICVSQFGIRIAATLIQNTGDSPSGLGEKRFAGGGGGRSCEPLSTHPAPWVAPVMGALDRPTRDGGWGGGRVPGYPL